ncbi:hypothetical protein B0H10DRAFT_1655733, partial [Mycena sp. CBHHK59/15]
MVLPRDIPTLRASSGNYTCPDNVFCSSPLLSSFISCDTAPHLRPTKTDHMPVLYELDIQTKTVEPVPRPLWRQTVWDEFRGSLYQALQGVPRRDSYTTREEVDEAIAALDRAIQACVDEHVPMSKPSPYQKRWWTVALGELKRDSQRVLRDSYRHRWTTEHPVHEEARVRRNIY